MSGMENMEFIVPLEKWYLENKRDLPWRNTTDPYVIWISEVILQQTRVIQGLDYFNRFMTRFPDVASLAEAEEDEVLKYWQGLGYYSRARNLHTAARQIMDDFGGLFPKNYRDVLSLKGIGEYTAAAICSFAYRQPYAVVDGNVYRVLARLFDIDVPIDSTQGKKLFVKLASDLLDKKRPDVYNHCSVYLVHLIVSCVLYRTSAFLLFRDV
jgi:A/G-specific adenine glycosylase